MTKISAKTMMMPELKSSFNTSMSLVSLVTNLPTGFLSKKRSERVLQMRKEFAAEIINCFLPDPLRNDGLRILHGSLQQHASDKKSENFIQPRIIAFRDVIIDDGYLYDTGEADRAEK